MARESGAPAHPQIPPPDVAALYPAQRRRLFGLAYRLTGSAEEAEDVVQEAFVRLLTQGAALPQAEMGPWLVRVTTNLGIDALRRRKRRGYTGPWLPSPVATREPGMESAPSGEPDPEARYGLMESVTYAFLVALEALGPRQRAVLLLRDVLGYSVRETAEIARASEASVRVLHLRARRALEQYDLDRCIPSAELRERHRAAIQKFLGGLDAQDARQLEGVLAGSVETITDSGGEFTALATPLAGRARVARLYLTAAASRRASGMRIAMREVNGLPAAEITLDRPVRRQAPRSILRVELDADGRIRLVQAILATRKLAALRPA